MLLTQGIRWETSLPQAMWKVNLQEPRNTMAQSTTTGMLSMENDQDRSSK